jgi:pimeloyl-ACP methyl ester carboxylesterase
MPLIITHGWPGSIVEFHKIIEPLTDPTAFGGDAADAFHVVAPSLPGFGFSGKPGTTGWGVGKIAEVFIELMARLGYDRYIAQGGDWGSAVTAAIGATDTEHCIAVHVTLAMGARPKFDGELSDEEQRAIAGAPADQVGCVRAFRLKDGGFIREKLLALSDYDLSCTYSILESPMGVENYVATLKLTPVTDGDRTFAEWSASFDCAPEREAALTADIGGNVFQGGFEALKQQFGG